MSDQTQDLFVQNTPPATPEQTQTNPLATILAEIKNERGEQKYKSVEDALIGLKHAQDFIPKIKNEVHERDAELADLRAKASKIDELERTLQELTQRRDETPTREVALKPEDIESMVSNALSKNQAAQTATTNQRMVVEALQKTFGDEAGAKFYAEAAALGLSKDDANRLAANSPKAVFKMLGITEQGAYKQPTFAPTNASIRTDAFQGNANSNIRKNDKGVLFGATTEDVRAEKYRADAMVEELHNAGMSVADLKDPKMFKKIFG